MAAEFYDLGPPKSIFKGAGKRGRRLILGRGMAARRSDGTNWITLLIITALRSSRNVSQARTGSVRLECELGATVKIFHLSSPVQCSLSATSPAGMVVSDVSRMERIGNFARLVGGARLKSFERLHTGSLG